MAIGTYAELQTAVSNWMAREDLEDRIPEFIALAEAKFNRELRCPQMETRATADVDTGNDEPEFISLPGDFQTMRRIRISSVTGKPRLEFLNQQQADDFRSGRSDSPGRPIYFTVFGDEIELLPTPDDDYEIEMVYRSNIPTLSDSNTSNWLLALAPDAYLYGALLEAAAYIKDDERVPLWVTGLRTVMEGLNRLGMEQAYGQGPLQMRVDEYRP